MSESIIEALNVENKMGESVASGANVQVSVSFGRFKNDSLSWEKWSSFSPNKYLDEVEKCSTPGMVAKKKAYFEAHYKKIASRKDELQEKQMETSPFGQDDPSYEDYSKETCGFDTEFGVSNGEGSPKGVGQDTDVNNVHVDELNEDVAVTTQCQSSSVEGDEEEMDGIPDLLVKGDKVDGIPDSLVLYKPEEAALVQEDSHLKGFQDMVELPTGLENETGNTLKNKEKNVKLDAFDRSQKGTSTKKENNLIGNKTKLALSPTSQKISNTRLVRPTSTSSPISAPYSSTKKASSSSMLKSKNPSTGESKRVAHTSLRMSVNLGPANSDSNLLTTRKSFILEKMGDKDIVKRAFKTFQNNFNQLRSSSDKGSSRPMQKFGSAGQVSTKGAEKKVSTSMIPRKENAGMNKGAEKMRAGRGRLGATYNSASSGSPKQAGLDQRNMNVDPSSFGLRSDERAEKRKELSKKMEKNSYAKEPERSRISSKSKAIEGEITCIPKPFSPPTDPCGTLENEPLAFKFQEIAKNESHRQPESQS